MQTNCSLIVIERRNFRQCSLPNFCFIFSANNFIVDLSDSTETITMKQRLLPCGSNDNIVLFELGLEPPPKRNSVLAIDHLEVY